MKNKVSFAQILQKKKSNNSVSSSRISNNQAQSPVNLLFRQSKGQYVPQHINKFNLQSISMPRLSQLMEEFVQFPNDPEENFILSFSLFSHGQDYQSSQYYEGEQDFQTRVNPLDSFIMTQSYLNAQKTKLVTRVNQAGRSQNRKALNVKPKNNKQFNIAQICKRFNAAKQNKNLNNKNTNNLQSNFPSKYSSRVYQQESMRSSQQQPYIQDSRKYGPTSPSTYANSNVIKNKQIIGNSKIIQSQVYQKDNSYETHMIRSKNDPTNTLKRQTSERAQNNDKLVQNGAKKLPRYQINYQQTQRKQQPQPAPVAQANKSKLAKNSSPPVENFKTINRAETKSPVGFKLTKKQSQNQELLIGSIQSQAFKNIKTEQIMQKNKIKTKVQQQQCQNQKRIQNAKKQINEYLQIRQKTSTQATTTQNKAQNQTTKPAFTKNINNKVGQLVEKITSEYDKPVSNIQTSNYKQVNYSFANNCFEGSAFQQNPKYKMPENVQSITKTKKQLSQIQQHQKNQQNERMLSCIQYTQSEVDADDNKSQSEESILLQSKNYTKNKQVRLSIPQNKHKNKDTNLQCHQYCNTLQKYLPHNSEQKSLKSSINVHQLNLKPNSILQEMTKPTPQPHQNLVQLQQPTYQRKQQQQSEQYQYSDMVQVIQVQPNGLSERLDQLEESEKYPGSILRRQLSNQMQNEGAERNMPNIQYDASSIDIQISDTSSQFCLNTNNKQDRQKQQQIQPIQQAPQQLQMPRLNQTDFQTISNISNPSPIRNNPHTVQSPSSFNIHSHNRDKPTDEKQQSKYKQNNKLHMQVVEVESHEPVSSHDSINIQKHENNYGFIYRMRVGSRNSSFTSDYNGSRTDGVDKLNYVCGSNHSSLNINTYEPQYQTSGFNQSINNINMHKNKQEKKYMEVQLSLQQNKINNIQLQPQSEQVSVQYQKNTSFLPASYNQSSSQMMSQQPVMKIDSSAQPNSMYKVEYQLPSINQSVRVSNVSSPVLLGRANSINQNNSYNSRNKFSVESISINQYMPHVQNPQHQQSIVQEKTVTQTTVQSNRDKLIVQEDKNMQQVKVQIEQVDGGKQQKIQVVQEMRQSFTPVPQQNNFKSNDQVYTQNTLQVPQEENMKLMTQNQQYVEQIKNIEPLRQVEVQQQQEVVKIQQNYVQKICNDNKSQQILYGQQGKQVLQQNQQVNAIAYNDQTDTNPYTNEIKVVQVQPTQLNKDDSQQKVPVVPQQTITITQTMVQPQVQVSSLNNIINIENQLIKKPTQQNLNLNKSLKQTQQVQQDKKQIFIQKTTPEIDLPISNTNTNMYSSINNEKKDVLTSSISHINLNMSINASIRESMNMNSKRSIRSSIKGNNFMRGSIGNLNANQNHQQQQFQFDLDF